MHQELDGNSKQKKDAGRRGMIPFEHLQQELVLELIFLEPLGVRGLYFEEETTP